MLESHRIGTLAEEDRIQYSELGDPFEDEPPRHPDLHIYSPIPMDAATPKEILSASYYTPADQFYIRNHMPVPELDAEDHEVTITLPGELCADGTETNETSEMSYSNFFDQTYGYEGDVVEKTFTLADLATNFKSREVEAALFW